MKDRYVTAGDLAKHLGLSAARLTQLKAEGLPYSETEHGHRFQLSAATRWYTEHVAKPRNNAADSKHLAEMDAAKLQKAQAAARLAELEVALRTGRAVAIEDVTRELGVRVAAARAKLLAMPPRLAPLLAAEDSPARCQQIIYDVVREALEELAAGDFSDAPGVIQ